MGLFIILKGYHLRDILNYYYLERDQRNMEGCFRCSFFQQKSLLNVKNKNNQGPTNEFNNVIPVKISLGTDNVRERIYIILNNEK